MRSSVRISLTHALPATTFSQVCCRYAVVMASFRPIVAHPVMKSVSCNWVSFANAGQNCHSLGCFNRSSRFVFSDKFGGMVSKQEQTTSIDIGPSDGISKALSQPLAWHLLGKISFCHTRMDFLDRDDLCK